MMRLKLPLMLMPVMMLGLAILVTNPRAANAEAIALSVESVAGDVDSRVKVPVMVKGADQLGPVQFVLSYDPSLLTAGEVKPGSLARGTMIHHETPDPGTLRVAMITDGEITGDGELLVIEFDVKGQPNESGEIKFVNAQAWEWQSLSELLVDTSPGTFTVTGAAWPWIYWVLIGVVGLFLALLIAFRFSRKRAPQDQHAMDSGA